MFAEEKVKSVLLPVLTEEGYDLVSVHYLVTSDGPQLQVVVDRDSPISLDDIVKLSDPLSAALDAADPIEGAYTLDISSAGAEKPVALEKLPKYVGSYVNLHLSRPYHGENIVEGELASIENGMVRLVRSKKSRSETIEFPLGDIDKARLAIKF
ncbi:MAG: Ribosome maturation factor RimP [Tenericutes bacterium ADurb.BinA155]|nr:MAG: Ribosome maturation factor RimP [Tenericutes bacterium ADurb.BinA155]